MLSYPSSERLETGDGNVKNVRYFDELLPDPVSVENLRQWRQRVAESLTKLHAYGDDAFGWCLKHAQKDGRIYHNTLLGLGRHILVYLDCVKVLLEQGCAEGCTPLLRSMLEATLGITHIVEDRHEERALAYQLARIKRRIKKFRMADKGSDEGQRVAAELAGDFLAPDLLDKMPTDVGMRADELERRLMAEKHFDPIVAEWDRLKSPPGGKPKTRDPEWYTLFSGADQIRTWAKKMKFVSLYLFLYKDMSNEAHAGDATGTLMAGEADLRPLRYPHGFHSVVQLTFLWFITSFEKLTTFYDPDLGEQFRRHVIATLHPEFQRLVDKLRKMFEAFP